VSRSKLEVRAVGVLALAAALAAAAGVALARELTSGPGAGLTTARCAICHDLEHILRSRLSRGEWEDVLANMRQRGMPPLADDEQRVILGYLAAYYGRDPAPPAAPDTFAAGGGDPVAKMLDAHACNGCHAVDRKLVGPAFRDVAAKYASDAGAAARLAAKIRAGGAGAWGDVPMPPNPKLSEADALALARWVLDRKQ
jgi:sulfite dehydrogenase